MYTRKGAGGPPRLMDCEEKPKRKTSSLCLQHQTGARRPGQAPGQRPGSVKAAAGIAQLTPPARNPDSSAGDLQMRARFLLLAAGGGRGRTSIPMGQLLFLFFSFAIKLARDFSVCPRTSLGTASHSP